MVEETAKCSLAAAAMACTLTAGNEAKELEPTAAQPANLVAMARPTQIPSRPT